MTISTGLSKLPVIIGGNGIAGAATSIGYVRGLAAATGRDARELAADSVVVLDKYDAKPAVARNIFLRPETREYHQELTGRALGQEQTIAGINTDLRAAQTELGIGAQYRRLVEDVRDRGDHVEVDVRDRLAPANAPVHTIRGSYFIDASGGRIAATDTGVLHREPHGRSHILVSAQFDKPSPFNKMWGVADPRTDELFASFPINGGGEGFVSYLDLPVGKVLARTDEEFARMRAEGLDPILERDAIGRFNAIAGRLQLGEPTSPTQAFDALQHLSASAHAGRIYKVGDAVGNTDPYAGAGAAAAYSDADKAVRALLSNDPMRAFPRASEQSREGHRNLGWQGTAFTFGRDVFTHSLPRHSLDTATLDQTGPTHLMHFITKSLTSLPVDPFQNVPVLGQAYQAANDVLSSVFSRLERAHTSAR